MRKNLRFSISISVIVIAIFLGDIVKFYELFALSWAFFVGVLVTGFFAVLCMLMLLSHRRISQKKFLFPLLIAFSLSPFFINKNETNELVFEPYFPFRSRPPTELERKLKQILDNPFGSGDVEKK